MARAKNQNPDTLYELAELYCERTDFETSCEKFEAAALLYQQEGNTNRYVQCLNSLLRMYTESEKTKDLNRIKQQLKQLANESEEALTPKTFYTLGRCASYDGDYKLGLKYLERSLALALAEDSKEDVCYAINGLAIVYSALGRYDDALKEIYNLQVFFQVLPLPKIQLSSLLLNGRILKAMGKPDQAIEVFWRCYDLLKEQKNVFMHINLLYYMGTTYADLQEDDMARFYLNLAKKSIDSNSLKALSSSIDKALGSLGVDKSSGYDLILKDSSNAVVEKKKGKIDFKNQFILLDMLRLFVRNPGIVYSKEELVQKVWKQVYDPRVHDNKIYVTIKRLRKIIEPDFDKPKYIFRAKNGYYLNKSARVLLE